MIVLGVGSNLYNRLANLRLALKLLRQIPELKIIKVSPVYESEAMLTENAPSEWQLPYLNAAISCSCDLNPPDLILKLKHIETIIGRAKTYQRWSPRLIDIDILAWDDKVIHEERLKIPQAGLCDRPFALWPLADLTPNWRYGVSGNEHSGKTATEIAARWGSRFTGEAPLGTRQINHRIDIPEIVGILNITTDSFSDGGQFATVEAALAQAKKLILAGAEILDIGAESTRPNTKTIITQKAEWQKLEPILAALSELKNDHKFQCRLSVDTKNPQTAKLALENFPIDFINDVTGCDAVEMRKIAAETKTKIIFMHHLGVPPSSKVILSSQQDVVSQICIWAKKRMEEMFAVGISQDQLIFDPGIGFGKSAEQCLEVIRRIEEFNQLGLPIFIGHSRKLFLSLFTDKIFAERDIETAAISSYLTQKNVAYLRLHNVEHNMRSIKVAIALK